MKPAMIRASNPAAGIGGIIHPEFFRFLRNMLGSIGFKPTSVQTSDYTATPGELVLVDPTAGAVTVTMPYAKDFLGLLVRVKNDSDDVTAITIAAQTDQTIDGSATVVKTTARGIYTIASVGNKLVEV